MKLALAARHDMHYCRLLLLCFDCFELLTHPLMLVLISKALTSYFRPISEVAPIHHVLSTVLNGTYTRFGGEITR